MSKPLFQPAAGAAPVSQAKAIGQLVMIGLLMQLIYTSYIVAFPLISNTQKGGPAADLEILMRDFRWFWPVYTAGIIALYVLFWYAMQIVSHFSLYDSGDDLANKTPNGLKPNALKLLILAFGLLFAFTLVWLYPITANDLFRYVLRGRIWAVYGESPMLAPPNQFPNDPYLAFAGEFGQWVSGYGPLWEIVVQVPLRLGAIEMVSGSISLKLVGLLSYLGCAALLGWVARPYITGLDFAAVPSPHRSTAWSNLLALTFFAWNPLILMQGLGNGHNDLLFMALMVLGLILWQRKLWWAAALALSLATLAKITGLLILPFFAIVLLKSEPTWQQRLLKSAGALLIGLVTAFLVYRALGPLAPIFQDSWNAVSLRLGWVINASDITRQLWADLSAGLGFAPPGTAAPPGLGSMLTVRRGFAIASTLRMTLREIIPGQIAEPIPRTTGNYIFILFYAGLMVQMWRGKLNLITAGFLAYFSQLMLGATFRIWYPMWLIPLAVLFLTPATFWRTFLFSLTAELSIINYFVVWRWYLNNWSWGKTGLLASYWNYWTVMHLLTVPWLFSIPLFGPIILKKWSTKSNTTRPNLNRRENCQR